MCGGREGGEGYRGREGMREEAMCGSVVRFCVLCVCLCVCGFVV